MRYCRHALDTETLVNEIDQGKYEDETAHRHILAIEALLSADVEALRRVGADVQADRVRDHAAALREWFNGWVGRGPNPGHDILQEYNRASNQARSMCR